MEVRLGAQVQSSILVLLNFRRRSADLEAPHADATAASHPAKEMCFASEQELPLPGRCFDHLLSPCVALNEARSIRRLKVEQRHCQHGWLAVTESHAELGLTWQS